MIDGEKTMGSRQLPTDFETFTEARKEGFLAAKRIKDAGGHMAGTFCTYTPLEIFDAAGIFSVSLCASSDETIPDAEKDLPKNMCPLIKSSYGFIISQKCPYAYFSDLIVGETTCDGKKKMYELIGRVKNTHIMQLPQGKDREDALDQWTKEVHLLIRKLESDFDVVITEEALRLAAHRRNELRKLNMALMRLQALKPPAKPMSELFYSIDAAGYYFDWDEPLTRLKETTDKIRQDYEAGIRPVGADQKRILITGCPIGGVFAKTVEVIEQNGGVVVCLENCNGIKQAEPLVDEEAADIVRAIAERYLRINCAVMSPNEGRLQDLQRLCEEYSVEGIVDVVLTACHPYNVETAQLRRTAREIGVPYLAVETDYSQLDREQLATRLTAFIEML